MDVLSSSIYGIVQGITEFLPVSSSGHLALLPHFMNINDPGVAFDLTMHVGTALAVLIYFWRDVCKLLTQYWECRFFSKEVFHKNAYCINYLFSTIITVVLAFAIKDFAATIGRSILFISSNLIFFGILMFIADKWGRHGANGQMDNSIKVKESLLIGLFQGFAVFPGVSRSGSTLTISRFLGISREEASRYSFLLSLPIILGGFILKLPELSSNQSVDLQTCLVGGVVSLLVGLLTIHLFLKIIKKLGLWIFSIYRIIFALYIFSVLS
jgi:undecaprenyl-diphosphatase